MAVPFFFMDAVNDNPAQIKAGEFSCSPALFPIRPSFSRFALKMTGFFGGVIYF